MDRANKEGRRELPIKYPITKVVLFGLYTPITGRYHNATELRCTQYLPGYERPEPGLFCLSLRLPALFLADRHTTDPLKNCDSYQRHGCRDRNAQRFLGTCGRNGRENVWIKMAPGTGRSTAKSLGRDPA